jgi:hypothetical protein
MGGRRVLVEGLTITDVVVALHGDRIGRRTGMCELPKSMQRTLHSSTMTEIIGLDSGRPCSLGS